MLPRLTFDLDADAADLGLRRLRDTVDDELEHAVYRAGVRIEQYAKGHHPFQNRTGRLEASIQAIRPSGKASVGTLQGGVHVSMPYASFVEHGTSRNRPYPYLYPAAEALEEFYHRDVEDSLERAVRRAGMGT